MCFVIILPDNLVCFAEEVNAKEDNMQVMLRKLQVKSKMQKWNKKKSTQRSQKLKN